MLYPFKFKSIYKEKIWGGNNLKTYLNKQIPENRKIGESWEISDHFEDQSIVLNGDLKGKTLNELLHTYKRDLLGTKPEQRYLERFPLLIKFIDANDKLSVQVHPDDDYANKNEGGEYGKTEMWYILHAVPGAKLIAGLKPGTTKTEFESLLKENQLEKVLNYVEVKTGDAIYIPAGRVHAILPGIIINEIQQNSDVTYRVYDWGRVGFDGKPRPLHIEKSLDVINFSDYSPQKLNLKCDELGINKIYSIVESKFFNVKKYEINKEFEFKNDHSSFIIFSVISGTGILKWNGEKLPLKKGESLLIPAALNLFYIKPENNISLILSKI